MLENVFTNIFGRSKSRNSSTGGRGSAQHDTNLPPSGPSSISNPMSGPFSASTPQMPQPPSLPYPAAAPYPSVMPTPTGYPSLPFGQPPAPPTTQGYPGSNYPIGTLNNHQFSYLDSVPFEIKLSVSTSTNVVSLDQLFNEIKQVVETVDKADAYLRSNQSDYDFKIEQGLIYQ